MLSRCKHRRFSMYKRRAYCIASCSRRPHRCGRVPLEKGAYINERPGRFDGITAWKAAYDSGHQEVLSLLERAGANRILEDVLDIDPENPTGWTFVYLHESNSFSGVTSMKRGSSPNGFPDMPLYKIRQFVHPRSQSPRELDEWSPLQLAARAGDEFLVKELMDDGVDVNENPCMLKGRTALQAAAEYGHDAVISQLIAAGGDVNTPPAKIDGRTALEAASAEGHLVVVRCLLAAGARPDQSPEQGSPSALWLAAAGGHLAVVEELLKHGADLNLRGSGVDQRSAAEVARDSNFEYIAHTLARSSSSPSNENNGPSRS